jgi:hypothetical protein
MNTQPEDFKRDYEIALAAYLAKDPLTKHQCEILLRFEKVVAMPNWELIESATRQLAAHRIIEANPVLKSDGFEDKARRWNVLLIQAEALNLTPAEQVEFIKNGMNPPVNKHNKKVEAFLQMRGDGGPSA